MRDMPWSQETALTWRICMQFLLFGTGDYYQRYKMWFNRSDIVALLDNSRLKQHTVLDGIEVMTRL